MCMYLSEGKNFNVDEITAVSYLEAFVRSGCYGLFFFFFFFLSSLSCQLETLHRYEQ